MPEDTVLELDAAALGRAQDVLALLQDGQALRAREALSTSKDGDDVNAALFVLCAEGLRILVLALGHAWQYEDRIWAERAPELRPRGRNEWSRFNFTLHASGCLLAGVRLDWDQQQYFLRQPLWPAHLALLALLEDVVRREAGLTHADYYRRLRDRLAAYAASAPRNAEPT